MEKTFSFLFIMLIRINLIAEKTINPPLPFHIFNVGKFGVEYLNLLDFKVHRCLSGSFMEIFLSLLISLRYRESVKKEFVQRRKENHHP